MRRTQGMHIVCHGLDTIWEACGISLDGLRPISDSLCTHKVCPPICKGKCSPLRSPTHNGQQRDAVIYYASRKREQEYSPSMLRYV